MLSLAASLLAAALSPALADREDELEDKRDRIGERIDEQHSELEHSSKRLQAATAALRSSQGRLNDARADLAATLGQLAAAQQLDRVMRRALVAAEQRLADAEQELAESEAAVVQAQDDIEQFAVQSYATSDPSLMSMDAILNGESPMEFTEMMSSAESVVTAQTATMDDLDAAQVLVALHEERVQQIRNEVAVKRQQAAENLDRKRELARSAREKRRAVQRLVAERRHDRQEAQRAREHDLRILERMERDRARVKDMLSELRVARLGTTTTSNGGGFLDYPVPGAYLTSPYGMRMHPVLHVYKLHDGTDFGAGCGTPILAPADGKVVAQYYNAGYGNRVIIAHGTVNGTPLASSINHLTRFSTRVGEQVTRGEVIGYVGTTGYSTGCHLHFMVYEGSRTVNPVGWL